MADKNKHSSNHGVSRGSLFFGLIRVMLSLFILGIFFIGVYLAFRSFSGIDPLQIDSPQGIKNILFSEKTYNLLKGVLSFDPQASLKNAKIKLTNIPEESTSLADVGQKKKLFTFAVVTDSHNDNQNLFQALQQAKEQGAAFVIGLGDYTDVGTTAELEQAKKQFETVDIPYYSTVGDHDLWDARNQGFSPVMNFSQVFGYPYTAFTYQNIRFILIFNSDIYLGIDQLQEKWIEEELKRVQEEKLPTFVFLSTPLYHPSSDHVMGRVTPSLQDQAEQLIAKLSEAGVKEVFAGDVHFYSRYQEPKTGLKMTVVGALASTRNIQAPRFVLVDVYESGEYNIQDIEVD